MVADNRRRWTRRVAAAGVLIGLPAVLAADVAAEPPHGGFVTAAERPSERFGADGSLPDPIPLSDVVLREAGDPAKLAHGGPAIELPDGPQGIPGAAGRAYVLGAQRMATDAPGCQVHWSLLASIGRIESGHARDGQVDAAGNTVTPILGPVLNGGPYAAIADTDRGVLDGDARWDRAVGPMQFIPSTWRGYASDGNADGVASPHNVNDAVLAAGRYLCADGTDLAVPRHRARAVFRYNHSESYVRTVLVWADAYARGETPSTDPGSSNLALPGNSAGHGHSGKTGSGSSGSGTDGGSPAGRRPDQPPAPQPTQAPPPSPTPTPEPPAPPSTTPAPAETEPPTSSEPPATSDPAPSEPTEPPASSEPSEPPADGGSGAVGGEPTSSPQPTTTTTTTTPPPLPAAPAPVGAQREAAPPAARKPAAPAKAQTTTPPLGQGLETIGATVGTTSTSPGDPTAPGSSAGLPGLSPGQTGAAGDPGQAGNLPTTGATVGVGLLVGIGLLAGGVVALQAARMRRRHRAGS